MADDLYEAGREASSRALNIEVIRSPYEMSAITAKRYGRGDQQGWHVDTNPITTLLFASVGSTSPLAWEDRESGLHMVDVVPGDALIFPGREIRHCVPVQDGIGVLVMILMNLYITTDTWRPPEMDAFSLGT
jgi:hypothetical protein